MTITFTETVSGFVQSEVSLSGSAASITSWSANSDDTVYTAMITPTASGTVTIGVAANVATDAANNPNTAATAQFVTVQINMEPLTWMPDVNLISQVLSALGLTDSNNLTQAGMATLTQLTATDANISDLTGLEHAINLTHLNLEGNSITNIIPIKGLDNLIYLNLSHNQLGEVSSSNGLWIHHRHWPNLQELDLSHNQIYCIGYSIFSDHDGGSPRIYADPLPSLTHLDVSYNGRLGDATICLVSPNADFPRHRQLAEPDTPRHTVYRHRLHIHHTLRLLNYMDRQSCMDRAVTLNGYVLREPRFSNYTNSGKLEKGGSHHYNHIS